MITRTAFICSAVCAAIYLGGSIKAKTAENGIGFLSPQAALQSLRASAGVEFSEKDGWLVATDKAHQTIWLFAHQGDPAYPTAVKRTPTQTPKGWVIGSQIMCGGTQVACEKVAALFAK